MAVSVNTVYQTVLYILNKEQRGYAPPDEFNSIAAQVQLEIFNSYFPDGNQVNRQNQNNTQNDTEYFNVFDNLSYKVTPFIKEITFDFITPSPLIQPPLPPTYVDNIGFVYSSIDPVSFSINPQVYILGEVSCTYNGNPTYTSVAQRTSKKEYTRIENSKLTKPTKQFPIYYNYGGYTVSNQGQNSYVVIPSPLPDLVTASAIMVPTDPVWGFTGGAGGQYINSFQSSIDFMLDVSEQTNLVIGILKYLGVVINDPTIIQVAEQEAQQTSINEKS